MTRGHGTTEDYFDNQQVTYTGCPKPTRTLGCYVFGNGNFPSRTKIQPDWRKFSERERLLADE